ncbi:molybdopterin molybdotransferase MoeA [Glaciihabitans sp. dw_435]|uniref:molybdopterin molybdotransferase MoeA n=1 Tax=Glaciihabitans sp. dw_435 TaxID=2720081 RepID=UPI001BD29519|nr:molybdopterin molybdotransferase MoeA [Glaciihabitans sp. dw_435]
MTAGHTTQHPLAGHPRSLSWSSAVAASYAAASPLGRQLVALPDAVGRVLAADVRALHDVPHYASSAMDGWAVCADEPWTIVPAGQLVPGQASRVVTGGLIPPGATAVLRSELESVAGSELRTVAGGHPPRPGQHIRPSGEEARRGETVLRAGEVLNPASVALAAGCGLDGVDVTAIPRVGLVFTGDEVVLSGIPAPGRVRDSFGPQLPAFVTSLGGGVASASRASDSLASTIAAIDGSGTDDTDVVITTGGTGHSPVDFLRTALAALHADLLIDGIAMRPGGPTLLARLPDGRFVVCLPGNPLAAMMGMLTVVHPLLAALSGRPAPARTRVTVASPVEGRDETTLLVPFRLSDGLAVPNPWRGSGMMRGLASASGVLVVPAEGLTENGSAEALPLPWVGVTAV